MSKRGQRAVLTGRWISLQALIQEALFLSLFFPLLFSTQTSEKCTLPASNPKEKEQGWWIRGNISGLDRKVSCVTSHISLPESRSHGRMNCRGCWPVRSNGVPRKRKRHDEPVRLWPRHIPRHLRFCEEGCCALRTAAWFLSETLVSLPLHQ